LHTRFGVLIPLTFLLVLLFCGRFAWFIRVCFVPFVLCLSPHLVQQEQQQLPVACSSLCVCMCVCWAQMSKLTFRFGRDFKSDFKERTITGERKKLTSNSLHLSFSSTSRYKWHFTVGLLCHNLSESYKELE